MEELQERIEQLQGASSTTGQRNEDPVDAEDEQARQKKV